MSEEQNSISLNQRIVAFIRLGKLIFSLPEEELQLICNRAKYENAWFTEDSVRTAFKSLGEMLSEENIVNFVSSYPNLAKAKSCKNVGVIMAGNIPGVGFHDAFCVLLSGHILQAKLSKSDSIIIKYLLDQLIQLEPLFKSQIIIAERLAGMEAVICTGSDNSARYFESYFGKYPHIIRKNRTSVALLNGKESSEEIQKLGKDIFTYYGLGCRNVTKVFVPENFDITKLIDTFETWSFVINQHKYANNYTYNRAIYLMNQDKFLDNNFLLLKETAELHSPISVLYYEKYKDLESVVKYLNENESKIQCIVTGSDRILGRIDFGNTQNPGIGDFADGIDTINFLMNL